MESRDEAKARAEDHAQRCGRERDDNGASRADEQPAQPVATDAVGPEGVIGTRREGWRLAIDERAGVVDVMRGDQGSVDRQEDQRSKEQRTSDK